ncbi:hypothetical protein MACH26_36700 [Planctobacterium marinum]|uniref:HTH tetR-type domain-containing protein n=1 Tax=Planctobacterium marinum TaxID=1631968 RepID=A0AA48KU25_9ALTE|nr:hypothetical protein MACH26_36700 [Planctobacterium marinum]
MRQVAANADMTLSNVQYYFKNKNELLKAMADRYFNACLNEMRGMAPIGTKQNIELDLQSMLTTFLGHGIELSEMCRIFREYWAISTRNQSIDDHIQEYYREMVLILSNLLKPAAKSDKSLSIAVSLLIPYVEGYSITAKTMPEDINSVTQILTQIFLHELQNQA